MNIELLLKNYRINIGKLKILEDNRLKITEELQQVIPDKVKFISGPMLSKTPFSITNKFKSLTEDAGIESKEYKSELQDLLLKINADIKILERIILLTETLLNSLGDEEKFVIEQVCICSYQWYHIPNLYKEKFQQPTSMRSLKRQKNSAIKHMEHLLQEVAL